VILSRSGGNLDCTTADFSGTSTSEGVQFPSPQNPAENAGKTEAGDGDLIVESS